MRNKIYLTILFMATVFIVARLKMIYIPVWEDETALLFVTQDFFSGNYFLQGWYPSSSFFFLGTLPTYLGIYFLGYRDEIFYIVVGISWGTLICCCIYQIYTYAEKRTKYKYFFCFITWLLLLSSFMYNFLSINTHVVATALSLSTMLFFSRLRDNLFSKQIIAVLVLIAFISGIISVMDKMFTYMCVIPIALVGAYRWKKDKTFSKICLLYATVSLLLAQIITAYWVYKRNGMSLEMAHISKTTFVNQKDIVPKIADTFCGALKYFHIDMWGQELFSQETLSAWIGCLVLALLAYNIYFFIRRTNSVGSVMNEFLFAFAGTIFFANMVSNLQAYPAHFYLLPVYIASVIVGIQSLISNIAIVKDIKKSWRLGLGILCLAFCLTQDISDPLGLKRIAFNSYFLEVADYLIKHELNNGYGNFRGASIAEYRGKQLGGNLNIAPVLAGGDRIEAFKFLTTNNRLYSGRRRFYLTSVQVVDDFFIPEEVLVKNWGVYKEKKKFKTGEILYIWEEPIMINSAYRGERMNRRMKLRNIESENVTDCENKDITIAGGEILFGPYMNLGKGRYELSIEMEAAHNITMSVTANGAAKKLAEFELVSGVNHCNFALDSFEENVEFLIQSTDESGTIVVKDIHFENMKIDEM